MKQILIFTLNLFVLSSFAQNNVGIGTTTPNPNAILDITSGTKGVLLPRMDSVARKAITNVKGMIVYDTTYNSYYFNNGTSWKKLGGNLTAGVNIGDMLYWDGTQWNIAPAGKPGQRLRFDSTSKPIWAGDQFANLNATVSNITDSSATINLDLISSGVAEPEFSYLNNNFAKGVVFSTTPNPSVNNNLAYYNSSSDTASTPGVYQYAMLPQYSPWLLRNTTYYVKAYVYNGAGVTYSNQVIFSTLNGPVEIPKLAAFSNGYTYPIPGDSTEFEGQISNNGGGNITSFGFTWTSSTDATVHTITATKLNADGTFSGTLLNLTPSTTYYFQAYATNSAGTGYSPQQIFYYGP